MSGADGVIPGPNDAPPPASAPPPTGWQPEVDELHRRQELARRMGGAENVVRGVSQVFVAGLPLVERAFGTPVEKEELGGVVIHGANGTVDNVVDSEAQQHQEIIDPRDTRPLLTEWVSLAYELEATRLGPKIRGARP